jgi:hypothetical protein
MSTVLKGGVVCAEKRGGAEGQHGLLGQHLLCSLLALVAAAHRCGMVVVGRMGRMRKIGWYEVEAA